MPIHPEQAIRRNGASNYPILAQRYAYQRQTVRKSSARLYFYRHSIVTGAIREDYSAIPDPIRARFERLASQWKDETRHHSSIALRAMHPAYQQIIGMGRQALPYIVADMALTRDHWFWALAAISGESPVSPEIQGDVPKMTAAWLKWAQEKGYALGQAP